MAADPSVAEARGRSGGVRVKVARVAEVPEGSSKVVDVDGERVGIYHIDGDFFAYKSYCPHRGAPICEGRVMGAMLPSEPGAFSYGMEGRVLRCPWHHWEFDLTTGKSLFDVNRGRLARYSVIVEGDDILLEMRGRRRPSR